MIIGIIGAMNEEIIELKSVMKERFQKKISEIFYSIKEY